MIVIKVEFVLNFVWTNRTLCANDRCCFTVY